MTTRAGEILCTEVVPRIHASIPISIKTVGAEDRAEIIQDTIAHAAAMLHRAEEVGKEVTASTVAFFAVKLTKSGRRSTSSSKTDVMHSGTQGQRRCSGQSRGNSAPAALPALMRI